MTTIKRIAALDGIRTLAMASVFIAHITQRFMGIIGLDIFFVLSGFVITRLIYAEHASIGQFDLLNFYRQRLIRLWPALLVVAATSIVMTTVVHLGFQHGIADSVFAATYNMDFVRAFASDRSVAGHVHDGGLHFMGRSYAADYLNPGFLMAHTWSLSLEEHFYLLWPLLFLTLRRLRESALILISLSTLLIATVIWRLHLWNGGASFLRVTASLDTRADLLIAGCLLALTLQFAHPPVIARIGTMARTLAWPSMAFIAVVFLTPSPAENRAYFLDLSWYAQLGTSAVGMATVFIIACFATSPTHLLTRLLSHRWLAWPGRHLSYGFYLWHFPIVGVFLLTTPIGTTFWPIALILSLLAALGSYYVVERPFKQWANRPRLCRNGHMLDQTNRLVGSVSCACGGHRIDHCMTCGANALTPKPQLHGECAAIASHVQRLAATSKIENA